MCPSLEIEPATLWFTGQHSAHWVTPARAIADVFNCLAQVTANTWKLWVCECASRCHWSDAGEGSPMKHLEDVVMSPASRWPRLHILAGKKCLPVDYCLEVHIHIFFRNNVLTLSTTADSVPPWRYLDCCSGWCLPGLHHCSFWLSFSIHLWVTFNYFYSAFYINSLILNIIIKLYKYFLCFNSQICVWFHFSHFLRYVVPIPLQDWGNLLGV